MLIYGPAVEAAQILICVFLPLLSTAIRTSEFSFVGALSDLLYIPQAHSLPSGSCGFNLHFVQLVGRFWVFSLSHTAPGVRLWFLFPPLHVGCPLGFAPEPALEDLGLPL